MAVKASTMCVCYIVFGILSSVCTRFEFVVLRLSLHQIEVQLVSQEIEIFLIHIS